MKIKTSKTEAHHNTLHSKLQRTITFRFNTNEMNLSTMIKKTHIAVNDVVRRHTSMIKFPVITSTSTHKQISAAAASSLLVMSHAARTHFLLLICYYYYLRTHTHAKQIQANQLHE